ncbi:MAG TPA: CapA family protein [Thermomicrobiaceae bacterium]|nr:CapA family protein [Thermomicrobiaceae bacterium]
MSSETAFSLALTGDSMITRRASVYGGQIGKILKIIKDADVAFTNLEIVPNDFQGYPAKESGGSHLAAHSYVLDDLLEIGFDLFATATNHSLNYSIPGLLALIDILNQRGATFAGIGRNLAEARMPAYFDHPAGTIALLSCASSFAKGQEASEQRTDMLGRPGLNPMRFDRIFEITPEQMATLKEIAEEIEVERTRRETIQLGFGFPPDSPDIFPFLDASFRESNTPGVHTSPKAKDLDGISQWVREARVRADTVLVSLHAHEQWHNNEEPAEFIPSFAHRMIDEGADVVVMHGPHLLRGIEIYRGKPIFYSLGNFFAQNELVYQLPSDSYDTFRIDYSATPGEVYSTRSQHDRKGFPSDHRYWETIVPLCHFDQNQLVRVEIVPVSLGLGQPSHRRGRPRLAEGDEATAILERLAKLCEPYGTRLDIRDGRANIAVGA